MIRDLPCHGTLSPSLEGAAAGENIEWTTLYADFAMTAKEEGFPEIARSFEQIAKVGRSHESRYRRLAANVGCGEAFRKKSSVKWHCTNCGYVFAEELEARRQLQNLPRSDEAHIGADIGRAFGALAAERLDYVQHLRSNYPYLYSLVLRTHPLQDHPSPVVT